nr:hypothetical protein [bacterium]
MRILQTLFLVLTFTLSPAFGRQADPPWEYEWNADEPPRHAPDFTFRGVLIARREADPIISAPTDGIAYHDGDLIGDAQVVYLGRGNPIYTSSGWCDSGLIDEHSYYFKLFSYDEGWNYSTGVGVDAVIVGASPTPVSYSSAL